jgi:hypothetical protein
MITEMLFSPQRLVQAATGIGGWSLIAKHEIEPTHGEYGIPMLDIAVEEAEEASDGWCEGQGFGSSDFTYAIMSYLQHLIGAADQSDQLEVGFFPRTLEVRARQYKREGAEDIGWSIAQGCYLGYESGEPYHMKGNRYDPKWLSDHDYKALTRADQQLVEAGIISQEFVTKNPIIS